MKHETKLDYERMRTHPGGMTDRQYWVFAVVMCVIIAALVSSAVTGWRF